MFRIDQDSKAYWSGAEQGRLVINRCEDCRHWIHPARARCPSCRGNNIEAEPTSGRGTIYTFTVSERATVLWVELTEQARLIVIGAFIGEEEIAIGDAVEVRWQKLTDRTVPVFEKAVN